MRMIPLVFTAITAFVVSGCTVVGAAADVTGAVISTTAQVAGAVIGGAASTVSGSSKNDHESH